MMDMLFSKRLAERPKVPCYQKKDLKDIIIKDTVVRADYLTIKNGPLGIRRRRYFKLIKSWMQERDRIEIHTSKEASVSKKDETTLFSGDISTITITNGIPSIISIFTKNDVTEVFSHSNSDSAVWEQVMRETFFGPKTKRTSSSSTENFTNLTQVSLTGHLRKIYGKDNAFMEIKNGKICLVDGEGILIQNWPMKMIRNNGYRKKEFYFETGSNYPDGHQTYVFKTQKGGEVHLDECFKVESAILKEKKKRCSDTPRNPVFASLLPAKEDNVYTEEEQDNPDDIYEELCEDQSSATSKTLSASELSQARLDPNKTHPELKSKRLSCNVVDPVKMASTVAYKNIMQELSEKSSPKRIPGIVDGSLYTVSDRCSPDSSEQDYTEADNSDIYSVISKKS